MQSAFLCVGHPNYIGIGITLTVIVLRLTLFIGVNDHSLCNQDSNFEAKYIQNCDFAFVFFLLLHTLNAEVAKSTGARHQTPKRVMEFCD